MKREISQFMPDGKTPRCCYDLVSDGSRFPNYHQCTRKAVVKRTAAELNGIKGFCVNPGTYCNTHDPVARHKRNEQKMAEHRKIWDAQNASFKRDAKIHELFPKLVVMCERMRLCCNPLLTELRDGNEELREKVISHQAEARTLLEEAEKYL